LSKWRTGSVDLRFAVATQPTGLGMSDLITHVSRPIVSCHRAAVRPCCSSELNGVRTSIWPTRRMRRGVHCRLTAMRMPHGSRPSRRTDRYDDALAFLHAARATPASGDCPPVGGGGEHLWAGRALVCAQSFWTCSGCRLGVDASAALGVRARVEPSGSPVRECARTSVSCRGCCPGRTCAQKRVDEGRKGISSPLLPSRRRVQLRGFITLAGILAMQVAITVSSAVHPGRY